MGKKSAKHLIVGASGHVGRALFRVAMDRGESVRGTRLTHERSDLDELDIRDRDAVARLFVATSPEVVYLCAGLTDIEKCERWHHKSYQTNVEGARNVIDAANHVGARMIYLSSGYIFDGRQGPYHESAPTNPLCIYGAHKLIAEHLVATSASSWLIIRTQCVYGWEDIGGSFVSRLMQKLKHERLIDVPRDLTVSPTYDRCLAGAIFEIVEIARDSSTGGVFHVAGASTCSMYKFALATARIFGCDQRLINPVSTADLGWKALHPADASLVVSKAQDAVKTVLLPYEIGLEQMLKDEL
ncbi:MAG: SDR family oxidoreductase [Candidatus Melainabacteria bacterium]|nr:SDR family oxidoreductase [Candidatus Melainabacteria bacterium]